MQKILQNHLLCAFVANLKIDAIYALYPESFCDKNLAIQKVFPFSDSGDGEIGGLQAIRQRKALTFISDVPSPTAAWNNKMSVVEQLVGTVWMHIFQGPPKSTVTHLTKLLIMMASNFGQLKTSLKPKYPSFARSQCWCPYLVLDQRCSRTCERWILLTGRCLNL